MSTLAALVFVVFAITVLGILLVELAFANRPGWQDLVCRMTLAGTLVVPLTALFAVLCLPNGLVNLPVLNSVGSDNNSTEAVRTLAGNASQMASLVQAESASSAPSANGALESGRKSQSNTVEKPSQPMPVATSSFGSAVIEHGIANESQTLTVDGANAAEASDARATVFVWIWRAWVAGSVLLFGYFIAGWLLLQKIRRRATPLHSTCWKEAAEQVALRLDLLNPPLMALSTSVSTPVVAGVARPIVLIPHSMAWTDEHCSTDNKKIEAILGHETMHIKRRDTAWNLLSCLALVLWWPIPGLHWVRRRMAWTRELLCDANAIKHVGSADYAEVLLRMATAPAQRLGVLALSMQPSAKALETRVRWILGSPLTAAVLPGRAYQRLAWACLALILAISTTVRLVPHDQESSVEKATQPIQESGDLILSNKSLVTGAVQKEDGSPVGNATVYLAVVPSVYWTLPVGFETRQTDSNGKFVFDDVENGNYMVWAEGDGLTSLKKRLDGQTFSVNSDKETEPIALKLSKGCNYEVLVVSAIDGKPIENAEISFGWTDTGRSYQTDSSGVASIEGLAQYTWYFVVKAKGFATTFRKTAIQDLGTTTKVKFSLGAGATIKGKVLDQDGDPAVSIAVYCSTDEMAMAPSLGKVETNMSGEFEISGLPLNHQLRIQSGNESEGFKRATHKLTIDDPESVEQVNLVCERLPYGGDAVITVVSDDNTPIQGAEILNRGSSSGDIRKVTTDAEGKARLVNMFFHDEQHTVVVRAKGKVPTSFKIESGSIENPATKLVTLEDGRTLRGKVVSPDGNTRRECECLQKGGDGVRFSELHGPKVATPSN